MSKGKLIVIVGLALLIVLFFSMGWHNYFSLESFNQHKEDLFAFQNDHPYLVIAIYFIVYVIVTGASLPGAALMTLVGGALFGLLLGTIIISFASTIGATIAFLMSRYVLRDTVQNRFGEKLRLVNEEMEKDGAFYLFTVRLVPAIPFFVINLVMGLTPIKTLTYFFVSQIGMLAGTIVYVFAGTQIATIDSLSGILSPGIIIAFTVLGLFPLLAKKLLELIKSVKSQSHP